jgi:FdrA protein
MLRCIIKAGFYKDSVALMRIAEALLKKFPLERATLVMATPANLEILQEAGLLTPEARSAQPSDLLLVLVGAAADLESAAAMAEDALSMGNSGASTGAQAAAIPTAIARASTQLADANLAQISVPGAYAAAEAMKAVKAGLHVFLFSDNVPVAQERVVKLLAAAKGLLVMGPDCGTAIINGVPLGFANVVRRGAIGWVAASGTGLQEVTTAVHNLGEGISQAIGTGGRDLKSEIGGITMLQGISLLAQDPATRVIGIVSKPPAPEVTMRVISALEAAGKPAVVLFLGQAQLAAPAPGITLAHTLEEAAAQAVALARGERAKRAPPPAIPARTVAFASSQRYLRGLYSGGTFCTEAQVILRDAGLSTWSNVPLETGRQVADLHRSQEHTVIDLGDDDFTVGRPHPMIDQSTRVTRLAQEARDPETAVVLLDVVLGYGAHADPAGELAPHLTAAIEQANAAGRVLLIVAFVCGTEGDPQGRAAQVKKLEEAGALVAPNSTQAVRWAAALLPAR